MRFNPTSALFGGVTVVFGSVLAWAVNWDRPGWAAVAGAFAVQTIVTILAYTVAHDAAHHTASRSRALNEFMLVCCGVVFLSEPYLFRRLHLMHHAHTDEADNDPDAFTAGTNWFARGVRAALLLAGYYAYAVRHWWREPRWRPHVLFGAAIPVIAVGAFAATGTLFAFLVAWAGPLLVAVTVLGLILSSAPHDARTRTTRNLNVPAVLRWLLGNGHLHLAHHLAPTVPWYRLPAFWRRYQRNTATAKSAR